MSSPFYFDESQIADRCIWRDRNGKSQCSIAKVVQVNSTPVSVNIQPLVNFYDQTVGFRQYPVLVNIPVAQIQTAISAILTPLNVGDTGIVLWFDREVYTTLSLPLPIPNTPNSGDLSDVGACVFLPMLPSFGAASPIQSSGVDFISNTISLLTQVSALLTQLNTFLQAIVTAGIPYIGMPTKPVLGAYPIALTAAATSFYGTVTTLQANIATFKGSQP